MVEELNVNAEFEVERPELGPIPDYSIFAEVKRTAEEQMLMRTGIEILLRTTSSLSSQFFSGFYRIHSMVLVSW